MPLHLEHITKIVDGATWLHPMDLALQDQALTVLLGPTQAGKTTLMRIMAGLEQPSTGRVLQDGQDVTHRPVRQRNVAMVYQQFINYATMTVFDNIAAPLLLRNKRPHRAEIHQRVHALAQLLHIEPYLQQYPSRLSGGQQQRVALARALAKQSPLMLLDEPLVNLDYKLREELREELSRLFTKGESTVVYATTDPSEALLLGGYTAIVDKGELLQYGPTAQVFHRPATLRVAQVFNDPPMNLFAAQRTARGVILSDNTELQLNLPPHASRLLTLGLRAAALKVAPSQGQDAHLSGRIALVEISGSDTFIHANTPCGDVVAQLTGVHNDHQQTTEAVFHFNTTQLFIFGEDGVLLSAPPSSVATAGNSSWHA